MAIEVLRGLDQFLRKAVGVQLLQGEDRLAAICRCKVHTAAAVAARGGGLFSWVVGVLRVEAAHHLHALCRHQPGAECAVDRGHVEGIGFGVQQAGLDLAGDTQTQALQQPGMQGQFGQLAMQLILLRSRGMSCAQFRDQGQVAKEDVVR
ncbi:hypothetical protein D3C75_434810 [compost metagenome]